MSNILNLKEELAPVGETSVLRDYITAPPEEPDSVLPKAESAHGFSTVAGLIPQTVAWKASVRPSALERRKEHVMMAFLAGLAVAVAIWVGSLPLVLIAGLSVLAWEIHHRAHHEADVHIDGGGVSVNGHRHLYARLRSFSIQQLPDESWHLSIKPSSAVAPGIRAPLADQNREDVRAILSASLQEEEHPIPISELFLKS